MNRISKLYSKYQKHIFPIVIGAGLCALVIFLHPSIRSYLFTSEREKLISTLIEESKSNNSINPQSFWKTREFTSPGANGFDRFGFYSPLHNSYLSKWGYAPSSKVGLFAFLVYGSHHWESFEFLTEKTSLKDIIPTYRDVCDLVLFESKNELICQHGLETRILFLKSSEEMLQANAYFDVKGRDGQIVKGKNWLVISVYKQ